jgi:hypothetical protein
MADPYPVIPQRVDTRRASTFGTVVDRAESGRPRLRTFHSQDWLVFTVTHECTKVQMQSILDHYMLGATTETFNFTYAGDGVTYVVRYADIPKAQPVIGDWDWRVEATLVVV